MIDVLDVLVGRGRASVLALGVRRQLVKAL